MRKHKRGKRSHCSDRVIRELIKLAKQDLLVKSEPKPTRKISKEIYLSESDRITRISLVDRNRKVLEVTNVSYEIRIDYKWMTIIRYDSSHGFLHRHTRFSLDDPVEVVERENVKQKGDPDSWYTWAIEDIKKRFMEYRIGFTKRSRIPNLGY